MLSGFISMRKRRKAINDLLINRYREVTVSNKVDKHKNRGASYTSLEHGLLVVAQLRDAFPDVVEGSVAQLLLGRALRRLRRPPLGQLLHGAHVDDAIVLEQNMLFSLIFPNLVERCTPAIYS